MTPEHCPMSAKRKTMPLNGSLGSDLATEPRDEEEYGVMGELGMRAPGRKENQPFVGPVEKALEQWFPTF